MECKFCGKEYKEIVNKYECELKHLEELQQISFEEIKELKKEHPNDSLDEFRRELEQISIEISRTKSELVKLSQNE